ncbi:MAG: hypothetical protein J1E62_03405 [Lachnospiraceae bacterium]|nr:hypothetical protein [Lachnospiraceae bacterium]
MAGTDRRQQDVRRAVGQSAGRQMRTQDALRQTAGRQTSTQEMAIKRQEMARQAAAEAAKLRQTTAAKRNYTVRRTASEMAYERDIRENAAWQKEVQEREAKEEELSKKGLRHWGHVGQWFKMFCWMHIPIFGFWYMVVTALRKKNPEEKRTFAKAFILYRVLVLLLALTILYVFYRMGLGFIEQILAYVDLHI